MRIGRPNVAVYAITCARPPGTLGSRISPDHHEAPLGSDLGESARVGRVELTPLGELRRGLEGALGGRLAGEPGSFAERFLSPAPSSAERPESDVERGLARLGLGIAPPDRHVTLDLPDFRLIQQRAPDVVPDRHIPLTDSEFRLYMEQSGATIRRVLRVLLPYLERVDREEQQRVLREVTTTARHAAQREHIWPLVLQRLAQAARDRRSVAEALAER